MAQQISVLFRELLIVSMTRVLVASFKVNFKKLGHVFPSENNNHAEDGVTKTEEESSCRTHDSLKMVGEGEVRREIING